MLRVTMTDNLHYQDVFQTNIPKTEHDIRLQTTYLLGVARHQSEPMGEFDLTSRFSRVVDSAEISQTFWEIPPAEGRAQRLLAVTAYKSGGFVVGLDRRPTHDQPKAYRKSLHSFNYVFDSDPQSAAFNGTSNEREVQRFYDEFYGTIATIALHQRYVTALESQNESNLAVFANAA